MIHRNLKAAILDLERHGHLVRVQEEVDPHLQMAAIHRRVNQVQGPALYFEKIQGCVFPAASNLFGTLERARFLFRHSLRRVEKLIQLKADPSSFRRAPLSYGGVPLALWQAVPLATFRAPVLAGRSSLSQLPLIQSWPKDGGPFITLPQVYSEDVQKPGIMASNLGMYRVQMKGNRYAKDREVGLHYQIHRGIGVHHTRALEAKTSLRVSIFVGGPPAHILAAVMPLPEALPEIALGGALAGRNFRYTRIGPYLVSADADFCILGKVADKLLPEGPFGDHLGYYALKHNFPVLQVEAVYHRKGAIWPFTVVGRPPQEDSTLGALIHELTAPMVPVSIPGLKAMRAIDAAGVHPLMLAIGRESYTPYHKQARPAELLTIANAILGFGQASLAKYLLIVSAQDDPQLKIDQTEQFFRHLLERVDWRRDLHFQTCTTMDTLDYCGDALNEGSRVVIAAAGRPLRALGTHLNPNLGLPRNFKNPILGMPGVVLLSGSRFQNYAQAAREMRSLEKYLAAAESSKRKLLAAFPLFVILDDSHFGAQSLNNFLWTCFTRSDPAKDIYGLGAFIQDKHWACTGPLLIDARTKPHHAPALVEDDPRVKRSVEALAAPGKSLHGII